MPKFDYQAFDQSDQLVSGTVEAPDVEDAKAELGRKFKSVLLISEVESAAPPAEEPPAPPKRRRVVYLFKAIDEKDQLIEGSLFAPSLAAACQRLEKMYVELVSIREKTASPEPEAVEAVAGPPLAPEVTASAFRSVCLAVSSGVSLKESLRGLASTHEDEVAAVFHRLANSVAAGKPFSLALKEQGSVFDEAVIAIIRAGESRGGLIRAMERAASVTEHNLKLRARCASILAYPLALASVTLFVLWAFVRFGLPLLAPVIAQSGLGVPFVTRWLLNMSENGLAFHVLAGFFVFSSLWLLLSFAFDLVVVRGADSRWSLGLRHLPVVGELLRAEERTRATRLVATLLEAGVHPSRIPAVGVRSRWSPGLRNAFDRSGHRYKETLNLGEALVKFGVVGQEAGLLIRFGEESEQVEDLARSAIYQADCELQEQMHFFRRAVEPAFIGGTGLLMVIVAVAAFVPMIQLLLEL